MLQEEIARLTGTLKFNVEARPLVAFEKRLGGVLGMLRELSTLANKKFTVKVALDSRSLRSQIERATRTKISLTNVDISQATLAEQGRKIQDYLNRTTIRLDNVRVDIGKLVDQKRFVKTMMGKMQLDLPINMKTTQMENELRRSLKEVAARNPLRITVQLNESDIAIRVRRAMLHAQRNLRALQLRVADPQVRLKVDRQHLLDEIRATLASSEFRIRLNARNNDIRASRSSRAAGDSGGMFGGRDQMGRGISAMGHFARGALPGLGAAFALSQMNDINQRVIAATNSLEAVSGNQANFQSNRTYLDNMTHEMGLNFRDIAPQFSSIYTAAAPAIGTGGVQDMFRGIMQYGTVHGLDREAMKGSMVALSQMFGKDKIQSEEARQQFAERMPNGMALLARAAQNAGATQNGTVAEFSELMEKGNADPKKILPELGKLMKELSEENDAYAKSLQTTRVQQGRMNKTFEDSVMIFARGGFDRGMASFFSTMTDGMERAKPLTEALGGAFELLVKPINALIRLVGFLGENWEYFSKQLGISKTALATLAASVAIFMLPFGTFVLALGAAVLALDDFLTYMAGGKSVFGDWVKETEGAQEAIDNLKTSWEGFKDLFTFNGDAESLANTIKGISFSETFVSTLNEISAILNAITSAVNRLVQIGLFAEQANESGTFLEQQFRGAQSAVMGKDWSDKFLQNKILTDMAANPNMMTNDIPGMQSLNPANIQAAVAAAIAQVEGGARDRAQLSEAMKIEIAVPISVQGMINAGDLASAVEEPMKIVVDNVFRQALGNARALQAERE